jgi:4-amino-4-deoxy-L-arabinose transferase-like glycosyltransferase
MIRLLQNRPGHYLLLLATAGVLFFPNLGAHSLWEVDEAHNAECAREMMDAGDWIVPTFNFTLRTDKPALLYWLMIQAYSWFGVNEFAARFWSAVAGTGSVLVLYELGRRMFDARTGLLGGIVLACSFMFCVSSHAATPDALLIFFTLLAFGVFWHGYATGSRSWLLGIGVTTALAVLSKGPVGFVLPVCILGLFLIWERRLRLLLDVRLAGGLLLFALIAAPWYGLVGHETKWEFFRGFFLKHNVERFQTPMEGHGGSFLYHPFVFLLTFAPWSAFVLMTIWFTTGKRARADTAGAAALSESWRRNVVTHSRVHPLTPSSPYRLLWLWFLLWLVFFSFAGTKLPNYLLPAFPAFALLTARFLVRWAAEEIVLARWWMAAALVCLALVGTATAAGLLIVSGCVPVSGLRIATIPELAPLALIGLLPIIAAALAWAWLRRDARWRMVTTFATASTLFVAFLAAVAPPIVSATRTPRIFADAMAANMLGREAQLACFDYYQPSLVFYSQRKIQRLSDRLDVVDHLHSPLQTYLIVSAAKWRQLDQQVETECTIVAAAQDIYAQSKTILLVTNRVPRRGDVTLEKQVRNPSLARGAAEQ